jgi:hypothetical protein
MFDFLKVIFWSEMPWSQVNIWQRIGCSSCFYLQGRSISLAWKKWYGIFPLLTYTSTFNVEAANISFHQSRASHYRWPLAVRPSKHHVAPLWYDLLMGPRFIPVLVIYIGSLRDVSHTSTYFSTLQMVLILSLYIFFLFWFVRLLALRPLLAYCASLGW